MMHKIQNFLCELLAALLCPGLVLFLSLKIGPCAFNEGPPYHQCMRERVVDEASGAELRQVPAGKYDIVAVLILLIWHEFRGS
jgi:hypothetical protein